VSAAAGEPILIAFSGGGDSRALLARALETRDQRAIVAAIVDHGLRPGSAREAEAAADAARAAGAEAQVLTLEWPDGPKPSQAAARMGRMHALAAFARAKGARAVHLAHTMDDQAETVLIRLANGSGWRGLAGMAADAPLPLWPAGRGLRLRRPLLRTRRAGLRDALRARGAAWIEDPSNEAARFQRVRARARLAAWEGGPLAAPRWAALAGAIGPLAAGLDGQARALIAAAARIEADAIELRQAAYLEAREEVRLHALAALLVAASGAGLTAEPDQLHRLDAAISAGAVRGATLGGAHVASSGAGGLTFTRDPGAVLGRAGQPPLAPLALPPGREAVWDGRVALLADEAGWRALPGPEARAPVLARGDAVLTLREAVSAGLLRAEWLLGERIAHLLWR
jgi:tRNA(Ile)-lysidine synthase